MKRRDLIKILETDGWWLKREGHNHTIYIDGIHNEPISRQKEIDDVLAKKIIKRRGLKYTPKQK